MVFVSKIYSSFLGSYQEFVFIMLGSYQECVFIMILKGISFFFLGIGYEMGSEIHAL